MTDKPEFEVGNLRADDVGGVWRYVIACGANAVIWNRRNGQAFYMTYRSERMAHTALGRVLPHLPEARIVERT
jgi:hypothetical protein